MSTIWKFPFEVNDWVYLAMPEGAQVLCVQVQHGIPCVWALVDPEKPFTDRRFEIYGTGQPIERDMSCRKHIGTFQLRYGHLVFHMFEAGHPGGAA